MESGFWRTTGAGRKPPSVPIWTMGGPGLTLSAGMPLPNVCDPQSIVMLSCAPVIHKQYHVHEAGLEGVEQPEADPLGGTSRNGKTWPFISMVSPKNSGMHDGSGSGSLGIRI